MKAERLAHALILAGVATSILAFLLASALAILSSGPPVSGGGCIVILFLPICFGFGERPLLMVLVVMLMSLVVMAASYFLLRAVATSVRYEHAVDGEQ